MTKPGCTLLALALCSTAAVAHADLAPPPADTLDCPRGAIGTLPPVPTGAMDERGRPLRPWPYCAPSTCTSDADCTGGRTCSAEEIGLCVEDDVVTAGTTVRAARERSCEPDGTCLNLQSTCERARRCVAGEAAAPPSSVAPPPTTEAPPPPSTATPAPAPEPEPEHSGWGCSVASGSSTLAWSLLIPLALLASRRRR